MGSGTTNNTESRAISPSDEATLLMFPVWVLHRPAWVAPLNRETRSRERKEHCLRVYEVKQAADFAFGRQYYREPAPAAAFWALMIAPRIDGSANVAGWRSTMTGPPLATARLPPASAGPTVSATSGWLRSPVLRRRGTP